MKCSQCGCTDLVEVKFPQEVSLILTAVGLSGETNAYDIKNKVNCKSFICVNWEHFEFFNLSLAEQNKHDIKKREEANENLNKIKNEITELSENISNKYSEMQKLETESLNLDISVKRYNEIQSLISNIKKDIMTINQTIKEKEKEIIKLNKLVSKQ